MLLRRNESGQFVNDETLLGEREFGSRISTLARLGGTGTRRSEGTGCDPEQPLRAITTPVGRRAAKNRVLVEQLSTITGSLQHFLQTWGYLALFVVAAVEAACIPFPSEVTFGFAGAMVALGTSHMNLPLVMVVGVVGEIIGSIGGYYIGKYGGRAVIERYGKYVLLSHHDLDRVDRFMERRGDPAVLIARMTPLLRSFSAIVAGIGEMPFWSFMIFTSIGTAIYGVAIAATGYALGSAWNKILKGFTDAGIVVAVIVVLAVVVAIAHRWRSMRAERASGAHGSSTGS